MTMTDEEYQKQGENKLAEMVDELRNVRVPPARCERSVTVSVSLRWSPKMTSGCLRLNHIIRLPQHASKINFSSAARFSVLSVFAMLFI